MSGGQAGTLLSIVMIAAILLGIGAYKLWRRGERGKAALMLTCALVMVANVAIWTV